MAGAIPDTEASLLNDYPLYGTRVTLWFAGLIVLLGGVQSMGAIKARQSKPRERGYFVVFEGGEGAGKTTQMEALVGWLEARGEQVVTTREPGGTAIGDRVRAILLDKSSGEMSPRAEALLYAADRAQHVAEVIRPALEQSKVVVSDRYVDSSLAYQGLARGLGLDEIMELSEWGTEGLLPDLVLYLQVDPQVGLSRIDRETDRLEAEAQDFHKRVAEGYAELARRFGDRFVVLDASGSSAEVHADVIEAFLKRTEGRTLSVPGHDLPAPLPR